MSANIEDNSNQNFNDINDYEKLDVEEDDVNIEKNIRASFIRKVYGVLSFQLIVTSLFISLSLFPSVRLFILKNINMFYILNIEQKLYVIACGNDIDGFHNIFPIIPVAYYVCMICFCVNPSVPHCLMCEIRVFRYTHSIDISAGAIVLLTPVVCVGVREDNLCASGIDTLSLSRAC